MMDMNNREEYRKQVQQMGKKEFTFQKMLEYGFWPKDLPTPYEQQQNETPERYQKRKQLMDSLDKLAEEISQAYLEKNEINEKLRQLKKQYHQTWDYDKIRADVSKQIMKESIARRKARKEEREQQRLQRSEQWKNYRKEHIVFIGKGYSGHLYSADKTHPTSLETLSRYQLPVIETDRELATLLDLDYHTLRFLCYHRDVMTNDHYHYFTIPKRKGGVRHLAAPKKKLKHAQRMILDKILSKLDIAEEAHGFVSNRSVLTSAKTHPSAPALLINLDLKDFFPTITFSRVRGMFESLGYSGYISSLLAMLCTYCERVPIEVKGEVKQVKISDRVLPQGSPASPMITNIICKRLDLRLELLAQKRGYTYTRYADDMSFSCADTAEYIGSFLKNIEKIVQSEGFQIHPEKTRLLRKNNRQEITGIVINQQELGVPKKWVKCLRAAIHQANLLKQTGEVPIEKTREIAGKIAWLKQINPQRYQAIIAAGEDLLKA